MNRQKKIKQQRISECLKANCPYARGKCIVLLGKNCSKLGGKRIPTQRLFNGFETIVEKLTHSMRVYYSTDGYASDGDEWR